MISGMLHSGIKLQPTHPTPTIEHVNPAKLFIVQDAKQTPIEQHQQNLSPRHHRPSRKTCQNLCENGTYIILLNDTRKRHTYIQQNHIRTHIHTHTEEESPRTTLPRGRGDRTAPIVTAGHQRQADLPEEECRRIPLTLLTLGIASTAERARARMRNVKRKSFCVPDGTDEPSPCSGCVTRSAQSPMGAQWRNSSNASRTSRSDPKIP
ncbi:unnamed protein product [Nesidiocoris tenuis]|uniref:Uncharacterized protein n=1 Tax=Nesidiocoris tenuis TaxID=355587 RepID=A0A6H5H6R3_9HEMI|nr:unnamed protein product [Nesidiocoris tenuis]